MDADNYIITADYKPNIIYTSTMLTHIAELAQILGRWDNYRHESLYFMPNVRRTCRMRSVFALLELNDIELSEEDLILLMGNEKVGHVHPHVRREVKNIVLSYNKLLTWEPTSINHLLNAHHIVMVGLCSQAGLLRSEELLPENDRLPFPAAHSITDQLNHLFNWISTTDLHPIIVSFVIHFEFERIQPFGAGNSKIAHLWQRLILTKSNISFSYIPIEEAVSIMKADYKIALGISLRKSDLSEYIEFMLEALLFIMKDLEFHKIIPIEELEYRLAKKSIATIRMHYQILTMIADSPVINTLKIAERLFIAESTVISYIQKLDRLQLIKKTKTKQKGFYWLVAGKDYPIPPWLNATHQ